jgi:hypothetical protein
MVFTNPIRTNHVKPPMNSIAVGGYRNIDVEI